MKKYLAEMVGTMVLVLMGCGVAVSLNCSSNCGDVSNAATVIGTSLAFGLSVVAMAYAIGGISGCHINPAITLGCLLTKRISGKDAVMYMVFQVIGAFIGSAILYALTQNVEGLDGTGANACQDAGCSGHHRCQEGCWQLCRSRYWSLARACASCLYPLYRHISQSSPFHCACCVPGWCCTRAIVDIHCRSICRCRSCCWHLEDYWRKIRHL